MNANTGIATRLANLTQIAGFLIVYGSAAITFVAPLLKQMSAPMPELSWFELAFRGIVMGLVIWLHAMLHGTRKRLEELEKANKERARSDEELMRRMWVYRHAIRYTMPNKQQNEDTLNMWETIAEQIARESELSLDQAEDTIQALFGVPFDDMRKKYR